MDELIISLAVMKECVDNYIKELIINADQLCQIIDDTKNNLGNDSIGKKTTDKLNPILEQFWKVKDEAEELSRSIGRRGEELLRIKQNYINDDDDSADGQYLYGQKSLHKELIYNYTRRK